MIKIEFDVAAARRHLSLIGGADTEHIFVALPEAPGSAAWPRHIVGALAKVLPDLENAQRAGCAVGVTVNRMRGTRRRRADADQARAVWCERDQPGRPLPVPPSLRVRTSPGRGHEYLALDPAAPLTVAEAERINRRIATVCGGDRQACDAARALRLAGSWHLKGEPHRVEIIGGSGETYGRDALLDAFPEPPKPPRPPISARPIGAGDRYVEAALRGVLVELGAAQPGHRNASLNRAAFRLGQLGLDPDSIVGALAPVAAGLGLAHREIAATVQSGATAGAQNVRAVA